MTRAETPNAEPLTAESMSRQRWYHAGRPWMDRPGMIYAGSEDPHAGTFVADTADDLGSNPDDPRFAPAVVGAIADLIVHEHNARLDAALKDIDPDHDHEWKPLLVEPRERA